MTNAKSSDRAGSSRFAGSFAALWLLLSVLVVGCNSSKSGGAGTPQFETGQVQAALTANGLACLQSVQCTSGFCRNALCTACAQDSNCPTNNYCAAGVCTPKKANGVACTAATATQCASGRCNGVNQCGACGVNASCDDGNPCKDDTCVAGVCVHTNVATACDDGNACSFNETCNAGNCNAGITNAPNATPCRLAAGPCDVAESCTGASTVCPANGFVANGTSCRASVGGCDIAETCTGAAAACPADTFQPPGFTCRAAAAGTCDKAEVCPGGLAACPADSFQAAGFTCRASAGPCDVAETCAGGTAVCPGDTFRAAGFACRASAGPCDVAEACAGGTAACPANAFQAAGASCRASAGPCDIGETCTGGAATCPADTFHAAGFSCRASMGPCDVAETCAGGTAACPADAFRAAGFSCRASMGPCDVAEACAGGTAACPADAFRAAGFSCRPSAGPCDIAEACTGAAPACPGDTFQAAGASCRAVAGPCDKAETCAGGVATCPADGFQAAGFSCRAAAGPCDVAEACTGGGATCPGDTFQAAGVACRAAAGACDVAETCAGGIATCPADVFRAAGFACRPLAGPCDVAETCVGGVATCPTDAFQSFLLPCPDDLDNCTDDYCSGIAAACSHPTTLACTSGLTATYYDNSDFTGPTVNRVDATVNFDWGNGSPDPSMGVDTFSVRWTGQVLADFSETYTFETESDDGVRLWVNDVMLVDEFKTQGTTKYSGTITLAAGVKYDIKLDYFENGGGATSKLRWKSASVAYNIIPTDHLFPDGDKGTSGLAWVNGADNGTGDPYVVWRLSNTPGVAPVDATAESANNWGLGDTVMMVPAFSPDGKKLVFIDGDSGGGAGWRKGLSTFDFDESGKVFSNRRSIRNTWPLGDVMKWPVWESDSQSIIFQTSTPTELCSCSTTYGNMAPTNYYGAPGTLWSIDATSGTPTAVQLTNLNTGERAADASKSYQPTVLPIAVGGYRWAVFTSTRPYGNTLNPPGIDRSCTASQLWVSAIDDSPSGGADRSHPAFWLPNQNIGSPSQPSFINERGYWVKGPCKPSTSIGPESACITNDDCCGAPTTAACRIDQPATVPPTRHCIPVNPSVCAADGGSCGTDVNCCGFPSSHCIAGACMPPAPVPAFAPGDFTRDYVGDCPSGTSPVWRFFDWQADTPSDSQIVFSAQTAATSAGLASAPAVLVGTASGPPAGGWVGEDVGAALERASQASQLYLRITMTIQPSSDHTSAPTISRWRQSFSCLPAQ